VSRWGYVTDDYLNQLARLIATDKQQARELFLEAVNRVTAGQVVTSPITDSVSGPVHGGGGGGTG